MSLLVLLALFSALFFILALRCSLCLIPALAALLALTARACFLCRQTQIDPLTGLFNRRRLSSDSKKRSSRQDLTVFYLDLDHLKQINDTQGHASGDRLLTATANFLRTLSPAGTAYRLGGDEFLVIFSQDPPETLSLPENIAATCGFARGPAADLSSLIDTAEQNMYQKRKHLT